MSADPQTVVAVTMRQALADEEAFVAEMHRKRSES